MADPPARAPGRTQGAVLLLGLALAGAVSLPLAARGWLLQLDWVVGPHGGLPRNYWGLDGGILAALPNALFVRGAAVLGPAAGWVPLALAVALAAVTMGTLVGGPLRRRVPGALLYAINPIVFERAFAGQVGYLVGYALLPLAVHSLRRGLPGTKVWVPAVWLVVLATASPHYVWILGVLYVAFALVHRRHRSVRWLFGVVGVGAVGGAYMLAPYLGGAEPIRIGAADLLAYRTRGDPTFGLAGNVMGLYGFWRPEPQLPKQVVVGWPFVLVAILGLAAVGARSLWKAGGSQRRLLCLMSSLSAVGLVLALGDQGPFGSLYRFAYVHVPGFGLMREPQKFIALLALGYAVGFAYGVEVLVSHQRSRVAAALTALLCAAVPFAYTPTLLWGDAGQMKPSHYPPGWERVNELMGAGDGAVLVLPWHEYLALPFVGHIVANPAGRFFRRQVIAGDNVELANLRTNSLSVRSQYLEYLYANGSRICSFGDLTAPLGVEYVVVAKAVDWQVYAWIDHQADVTKVFEDGSIALYRNQRYRGVAYRVSQASTVTDWSDLVRMSALSSAASTTQVAVTDPNPARRPAASADSCAVSARAPLTATRTSATGVELAPGPGDRVVLTEPFDPGWRIGGRLPLLTAEGSMAVPAPAGRLEAVFVRWRTIRLGYVLSVLALAAASLMGARVTSAYTEEPIKEHERC